MSHYYMALYGLCYVWSILGCQEVPGMLKTHPVIVVSKSRSHPAGPQETPIWNATEAHHVPSGDFKLAIENGHRNSEFSRWQWWFPIVLPVYQRVCFHGNIDVPIITSLPYHQQSPALTCKRYGSASDAPSATPGASRRSFTAIRVWDIVALQRIPGVINEIASISSMLVYHIHK